MAFGDASTINTVKLTGAFNQMLRDKVINLMSKQNGFLFAMTGGKHPAMPPNTFNFKRHEKTSGVAVEWSMLGKLLTPATIADGAAEAVAAAAPTYDDGMWANATLTIPQLLMPDHPVTRSDMERIAGSEKKTVSHFDRVAEMIATSWQRALNIDFATDDATGIVGVPWAVDNLNTYATINRTTAGNEQFKAKVLDKGGAQLQYTDLYALFNECSIEGGNPRAVFMGLALYNSLQTSIQSFIQTDYDPVWDKFGGRYVKVGNMIVVLEPDLPAGMVIGMDPTTWVPIFGNGSGSNPFTSKIFLPDEAAWLKASGFVRSYAFIQLVCLNPRFNFKIINATA